MIDSARPPAGTPGASNEDSGDGGFLRGVAVTTVTLVAARVVALVAGIALVTIATRYLGQSRFGALNVAMAYASLFALLTDLGISTVATREIARDPARERQILGNVVSVGLLCAVVAVGVGLGLMEVIYPGASNSATREGIAILLTQVFAAPVTGAARAHFTARQRGYLIATGDVALAVGMAAFMAVVAAAHLGYQAAIIAVAGGYMAQAAVMGVVAIRSGGLAVAYDRTLATMLVRLSLPLALTLVLNYLYFRLDILLLSWLKSDADVAHYALAYRVLEGLMVLPTYLMLALFPEIARSQDDRGRLAETIGAALATMEAIALPLVALLATFSSEVVALLAPPQYRSAGPVLAILALALGLSYLNGVYGNALVALGRQRALLWITVPTLAANAVINLIMIPPFGVLGAAAAVVISEVLALVIVRGYYLRVAGRPRKTPHVRILLAGLPLGGVAAVKFALALKSDPGLVIVVGGTLGMLMYSALLVGLGALPASVADRLPVAPWLARHRPHP